MPWGDGTGPWGAQGRWNCWRGRRFGRGAGRGYGRFFGGPAYTAFQQPPAYAAARQHTKEEEVAELKTYAAELKAELNNIERRLKELEGK
jgi:hypothetical protein